MGTLREEQAGCEAFHLLSAPAILMVWGGCLPLPLKHFVLHRAIAYNDRKMWHTVYSSGWVNFYQAEFETSTYCYLEKYARKYSIGTM